MPDGKIYELTIRWDTATDEYHLEGMANPPWVLLGMLEYAATLVRKTYDEKTNQALRAQQPRIVIPRRAN